MYNIYQAIDIYFTRNFPYIARLDRVECMPDSVTEVSHRTIVSSRIVEVNETDSRSRKTRTGSLFRPVHSTCISPRGYTVSNNKRQRDRQNTRIRYKNKFSKSVKKKLHSVQKKKKRKRNPIDDRLELFCRSTLERAALLLAIEVSNRVRGSSQRV